MKYLAFIFVWSALVMTASLNGQEHHHETATVNTEENLISASGIVKSIAEDHRELRIFHDPIPALKWPAMNMPFEVRDQVLLSPIEVGKRVNFEFVQQEGKNIIIKISQ